MQTARRDHGRNAVAGLGSPPPPPPPTALRVVKNASGVQYAAPPPPAPAQTVDPKWLEDAVLRILKKHALLAPAAAESEDLEEFFELQRPSRGWRFLRGALIVTLLAGGAGFAAHWRYPVQTGAALSFAKEAVARIPLPHSWTASPIAPPPAAPSSPSTTTLVDPGAPVATPPAVATPAPTTLPLTATAPTSLPISPLPPPEAKPVPSSPSIPAETKPAALAPPKVEAKPAPHATHAPSRAAVAVAPPTAAAPPEAPSPIPGSLGEAIRRAGGTAAATPAPERAATPEAKPSPDAALPDRPAASLVTSALLAALPDARSCLSAGEETKAIVVFASSGAVSSVQVGGASAACIQKAFAHTRVPPFAQPTYRAGVPIRAN